MPTFLELPSYLECIFGYLEVNSKPKLTQYAHVRTIKHYSYSRATLLPVCKSENWHRAHFMYWS